MHTSPTDFQLGRGDAPAPTDEFVVESRHAAPDAAEATAAVERHFEQLAPDRRHRLSMQAQKLVRDLGITYQLYRKLPDPDHVVPFDLFPRIVGAEHWRRLSQGIAQRMRIWNAFFRDLYSHQEILRADVIPFEWIYNDPQFLRQAVGLRVPEDEYVHTAAFDLARDAQGHWVVIEDHMATMTGLGYAQQCRNVLSHVIPELPGLNEVRDLQSLQTDLLDRLQGTPQAGASEPRVVMLTSDSDNSAFYEHSVMARQMGVPLVRGNDLIVLNTGVFLRTIGGLEPIDVIYRRIDEQWLDPLEFAQDSAWGVPGLMTCVRNGTVRVANAIGTGLGNNRAVSAHMHRLARFYFNEPLILPTVGRLLCSDYDQRELLVSRLTDYRVSRVSDRSDPSAWDPAEMSAADVDALLARIDAQPAQYVAERRMPLNLLPALTPEGIASRHAGLRLFAWGGARPTVPSCALTRFATQPGSRIISSGLGGGVKDTWILSDAETEAAPQPLQVLAPQRRLRLGSRIADSLYWTGRYLCRAENTARILKVMQQLETEERHQQHQRSWNALWEALARATGHATNFFKRSKRFRRQTIADYILLDTFNPSSVLNSIRGCRLNAQATREAVPPEMWYVINRLFQMIEEAAESKTGSNGGNPGEVEDLTTEILTLLDALSGTAAKNMLHDDGWHFWNLGIYLERAINTLLVMRQVFLKRTDDGGQNPRRDESNLDALLRMLACQYAYRSLFQARPTFGNVASLVLQDPQLPRSLLFCLMGVRDALQAVFGTRFNPIHRDEDVPPLRHCIQLISEVEFADLSRYFDPGSQGKVGRLRHRLDGLAGKLEDLATRISDHYLNHQTFKILR